MPKKKTVGQPAAKMETVGSVKTRTPQSAAKAAKTSLSIDYPLEGEILTSSVYTIRLTALAPVSVEVSLDGDEWLACRESVGHWWHDWSGFQAGVHTLVARMKDKKGKTVKAKARQFTVIS